MANWRLNWDRLNYSTPCSRTLRLAIAAKPIAPMVSSATEEASEYLPRGTRCSCPRTAGRSRPGTRTVSRKRRWGKCAAAQAPQAKIRAAPIGFDDQGFDQRFVPLINVARHVELAVGALPSAVRPHGGRKAKGTAQDSVVIRRIRRCSGKACSRGRIAAGWV